MTLPPQNLVQVNGITQASDAYLNTLVQWVPNVAALRSFTGIGTMTVDLLGTSSLNDGGQGLFYWNAGSTATDDNGVTTVVPNGSASGVWSRSSFVTTISNTDGNLTISPKFGNVIINTSGLFGGIAGTGRNVLVKQTSNTTANITADEFLVETALGGNVAKLTMINPTLNAATVGVNGLDTGSLVASSYYAIYIIYNPATTTFACLGQLISSSPPTIYGGTHMPSGYTMSALIGILATDGASHFLVTTQIDREVFYQSAQTVFTNQANTATFSAVVMNQIPNGAKSASGYMYCVFIASQNVVLEIASDSSGTGLQFGGIQASSTITNATQAILNFRQVPIIAANTLYIQQGNTATPSSNGMLITSFTF